MHMTADEAADSDFDKMDTAAVNGAVNGAMHNKKSEHENSNSSHGDFQV